MLKTTDSSYHLQKFSNLTIHNFDEWENYIKKILVSELAKFSLRNEIVAIQEHHEKVPTRPTIVFMGEIKAGKSSLINALLGEQIVKVKSTVATAKNTYIDYGEDFAIYVHYYTGVKRKITLEQLEKYTVEEASTLAMRNKVEYIQIYIPHPLLKAVRLVDSPGLNSQNEHHTEETEKLFQQATTIYWIFNHGMVGRKSEYITLKQLNKLNDNIIGVVNMIDLHYELSDEPITSYLQDIEQKMSGYVKQVIGVSATYALEATEEENDDLWEDSNFDEFIQSILSNSFEHEQLATTLIKPIFKQITDSYNEAAAARKKRDQLATQWTEKYENLQQQVTQFLSHLNSFNKETETTPYNTVIDLAFLKQINEKLYDSITQYAQAQSENLQKLCLFIQNNMTGKDVKMNATQQLLKTRWNEFNEQKVKQMHEKIEKEATKTIRQYIQDLNAIYVEWQKLNKQNESHALQKFLLKNEQLFHEKFHMQLPDASKLKIHKANIHQVEQGDYNLPIVQVPNFAEMALDFESLMNDLYEVAYDAFSEKLKQSNFEVNIEEMTSLDEQLQQLECTYLEEKEQTTNAYETELTKLQTITLMDLLDGFKLTPNFKLNEAMKKLSFIANRNYSIEELVEITDDMNNDSGYWRSLHSIRMKLEHVLQIYYFEKWHDKQEQVKRKAYREWSDLRQQRNMLEQWRTKNLQLIGTPQIRRVADVLLKQHIRDRDIVPFQKFAALDEWDSTTASFIHNDLGKMSATFGENFYSNRVFLVSLMIYNEQRLSRLMHNFSRDFLTNVNNYKNNRLEYKEKVESYKQFDDQIYTSLSFKDLKTSLPYHCPSAFSAYKKITDIIYDNEKEVQKTEILMKQRIERGSLHLSQYDNLPSVFMSKNVKKTKQKIIKKIRIINDKQKKTYNELEALQAKKNTEIKMLYITIPTAIQQRLDAMNEELHAYTTRINNCAIKQQTLNEQLIKWNKLVELLNKEPIVKEMKKPFRRFTEFDVGILEQVELQQVAYRMANIRPELMTVLLETCPVPVFPKFYIPIPFYLFLAIVLLIGAVILNWFQPFIN